MICKREDHPIFPNSVMPTNIIIFQIQNLKCKASHETYEIIKYNYLFLLIIYNNFYNIIIYFYLKKKILSII